MVENRSGSVYAPANQVVNICAVKTPMVYVSNTSQTRVWDVIYFMSKKLLRTILSFSSLHEATSYLDSIVAHEACLNKKTVYSGFVFSVRPRYSKVLALGQSSYIAPGYFIGFLATGAFGIKMNYTLLSSAINVLNQFLLRTSFVSSLKKRNLSYHKYISDCDILDFCFKKDLLKYKLFSLYVSEFREADVRAPGIIKRVKVFESLFTGVPIIDCLIPVGRGQRELIIGDRYTGKTTLIYKIFKTQTFCSKPIFEQDNFFPAIAADVPNLFCVYVSIAQKVTN